MVSTAGLLRAERGLLRELAGTLISNVGVARGVSPLAVCSYHTDVFFGRRPAHAMVRVRVRPPTAPKLSCLTAFLANETAVPDIFENFRCEAYGPGGVALIIECRTDNRVRTVAQLRELLREHGGYIGARGSVSYLFNEVGQLKFAPGTPAARVVAVALEAGAEEVIRAPLEVLTDPIELESVRAALQAAGFVPVSAQVTQRASSTVPLAAEGARALQHLIEALKDLKDVETVYTNVEIPDEVLARA